MAIRIASAIMYRNVFNFSEEVMIDLIPQSGAGTW
jgi:hypothetical protein